MAKLTKAWRSSSDTKVTRALESRTMALARTEYEQDNSIVYPATETALPHTVSELHWAVRAMTAEVKLSERERHHKEITSILERIIYALLASVVGALAIWSFAGFGGQENTPPQTKGVWRPHFTIPILSPFTSIVEHEMSKVGFRTTAVFLFITGIVVYALVRHRVGH